MPGAPIDLRSDTVTRPSAAMRRAIAEAEVGDDVWGEDPTVIRLEERVAALLGKQAALFVPSGSMANQIALLVHTRPGDEVIVGWGAHCVAYESGAGAAIAGVMFHVLGTSGLFAAEEARAVLRPPDVHHAPTRLLWVENTHNQGGGRVFPQAEVEALAALGHARGLALHIDGARLLNAAVALGRSAAELAAPAQSASICLSKGLGAPVGSVLAGSAAFVAGARRFRKMLGGGMRQAGLLAAAGLFALEHNVDRLAEDHARARSLARGLAELPGVRLDPALVETNIVIFELDHPRLDPPAFLARCRERGLLLAGMGGRRIRAVTHLDVTTEECEAALGIVREVLA